MDPTTSPSLSSPTAPSSIVSEMSTVTDLSTNQVDQHLPHASDCEPASSSTTIPPDDHTSHISETMPSEPLIHLPPSPSSPVITSQPSVCSSLPRCRTSALIVPPSDPALLDIDKATMTESVYSCYLESEVDSRSMYDQASDVDSIFECCQAKAVRYLHPGRPSIIDLMRADRPTFKRASQITVRRPIERPFLSPIQPPKRYRRSVSPDENSDSSSYSSQYHSSHSSRPTTPTLLDNDEEGNSSPASDGSPSSPETPRSSFDQEDKFQVLRERSESSASSTAGNLKSRVKIPSKLRIFPKRTVSVATDPDVEFFKSMHPAPAFQSWKGSPATMSSITVPKARGAGERETIVQLPPSPIDDQPPPLTARHSRSRSLWRHKIRRVESRVGLNVH